MSSNSIGAQAAAPFYHPKIRFGNLEEYFYLPSAPEGIGVGEDTWILMDSPARVGNLP
jgi:hypothetical protein